MLNISVPYRMYMFFNHYISFNAFYKINSISYRLIDLVWIDRIYNKLVSLISHFYRLSAHIKNSSTE
jgi:hypothetical protein